MTGDDFIRLANRLALATTAAEPEWRTAVSRAYYGAFHMASALLESAQCPVTRQSDRACLRSAPPDGMWAG
ncbi:MAG TPA: hypothetical protein VGX78_12025 [Pirellulales bacterium]|jgi:hypothetical protein|nr:hypothetical protein [Pirellulales bacterium]